MGLLGEMTVKLGVNTSSFTSGMGSAGNTLKSFANMASSINPVAGALVNVGEIAIGVGEKTAKMAGDFQSGLTTLVTGAGEAQSNIQMVSDGILKLAVDTGTTTKQLTDGMYMIESAGYHGAAGLDVLKNAAEGAKVGNASLAVVANGVTTIMTDYAASGVTASQATNTLIATVANGKTNMQALATAMSSILPTSSALHVSLNDTAGAMATLTGEGVSAATSATYLRQLLVALENPAKKGADALRSIGLTSEEVSASMKKSLPDTLKMITDHLKEKFPEGSQAYIKALADISGGSKQMQGMLDLTGDHLKTFEANVSNVADSVKKGGSSVTNWSLVQQDFNFKLAQAKEVVETLGIKVGTALLPIFGKAVDLFTSLLSTTNPLTQALQGMANSWKEFADSDGAKGAAKSFLDFGSGVQKIVAQVAPMIIPFINNLNNLLIKLAGYASTLVGPALTILQQIVAGAAQYFKAWMSTIEQNLMPAIEHLASVLAPIIKAIMDWIIQNHVIQNTFLALSVYITIVIDIISFLINVIAFVIQGIAAFVGFIISIPGRIVAGWTLLQRWWAMLWAAFLVLLTSAWQGILKGIQNAWLSIVSWVSSAGKMLLDAIMRPFVEIGQAFIWLYNHNTYVKMLVDAVVGFFTGLRDRAVAIWNYVTQWLNAQWAALQVRAMILWRQISDAITGPINQAKAFAINAVNTAHQFISDKWSQLSKLASDAWGKVSSVFSSAWNTYIAKPLGDLWKRVSDWWNNTVIGGMRSLGSNMIHSIADGISGAGGAVGDALHSAISSALNTLGFHGIPGFASGIRNFGGGYALVGENGPELVKLGRGSDVYTTAESRSMLNSSARSSGVGGGSGDGNQTIIVQLDSDVLMHAVGSKAAKQIRVTHGRRVA